MKPEGASEWSIPPLRVPTADEHRAASLQWLAKVQPTLIDQWPAELAALSMPTKMIRVDAAEMFDAICDLQDGRKAGMPPLLIDLATELDAAIGWERKFVKLNSRSPKDWPFPFEVPATISGKEAVSILASSERIISDLLEFQYVPEQPAFICLREFIHWVRGVNEFRCFVKNGDLIAVSHYDYTKPVPDGLNERAATIRASIDNYFSQKLRHTLPIDTVVFDVAMDHNGELLLIEINPYGASDPCWFGTYADVERASQPIQFTEPEPRP